jgi:hypothetical protein
MRWRALFFARDLRGVRLARISPQRAIPICRRKRLAIAGFGAFGFFGSCGGGNRRKRVAAAAPDLPPDPFVTAWRALVGELGDKAFLAPLKPM